MKTAHKIRKRDLCQCEKPRPSIIGGNRFALEAKRCRRCWKILEPPDLAPR
jgi:hypothetical protein